MESYPYLYPFPVSVSRIRLPYPSLVSVPYSFPVSTLPVRSPFSVIRSPCWQILANLVGNFGRTLPTWLRESAGRTSVELRGLLRLFAPLVSAALRVSPRTCCLSLLELRWLASRDNYITSYNIYICKRKSEVYALVSKDKRER